MTAAELIKSRVDADQPNMGLTTWKESPKGKIRKADVTVAKNYLSETELSDLNRIVTMYLDYAEDQARQRQTMTMSQWAGKLDAFLEFNNRRVLQHAGKVQKKVADQLAHEQFEQFDAQRRWIEAEQPTSDFDHFVEETKKRKQSPPPEEKTEE